MTVRLADRATPTTGRHHRRRFWADLLGDLVVAAGSPVGIRGLALFAVGLVLTLANIVLLLLHL
jgi:hypothetical protein